MFFKLRMLSILMTGILIVTSCSSDNKETALMEFDAQENFANLEQELLTVDEWEDSEDELQNGRLSATDDEFLQFTDCVTRSWEWIDSSTRKLTVDYGTEPCLGNDGLYRRGIIEVVFHGPRYQPGATRSTTFIGYFVMNVEFNGTKDIEYLGNRTYTREVDITRTVGANSSSFQTTREIEKIAGYLTPARHDDIFKVTGSGSGIKTNGVAYTSTIVDPLIRKLQAGCFENFVDGEVLFVNENDVETLLDYDPIGGAPCDKLASITRNGETHLITLW